jgi:hypothetical protein
LEQRGGAGFGAWFFPLFNFKPSFFYLMIISPIITITNQKSFYSKFLLKNKFGILILLKKLLICSENKTNLLSIHYFAK